MKLNYFLLQTTTTTATTTIPAHQIQSKNSQQQISTKTGLVGGFCVESEKVKDGKEMCWLSFLMVVPMQYKYEYKQSEV